MVFNVNFKYLFYIFLFTNIVQLVNNALQPVFMLDYAKYYTVSEAVMSTAQSTVVSYQSLLGKVYYLCSLNNFAKVLVCKNSCSLMCLDHKAGNEQSICTHHLGII